MKLNYKRTFLIGFAFLSISAFWQMYDNVIPLILKNTFGLGETVTGAIMAADNVLALFLLPVFGSLSDKVKTPIGRRMPFILGGTALAFVFIMTMITHRVLGFKTPALIEYALQTNLQISRVFRIVLFYTIALGLLGLWNARVPNLSFVATAFLFLGYLTYQFLNWSDRPTFKNVFNELKSGYAELKKEVVEMKNQRAKMKAHKAHSTHVAQPELAKVSAKTVKKTTTKPVRSVKKKTEQKTSSSKTKPTTLQKATHPRKRKKTGSKVRK